MATSNVAAALRALEPADLILRWKDPADTRRTLIELTGADQRLVSDDRRQRDEWLRATASAASSPHGCPGPSTAETNAGGPRPLRPPGKRHALPDRYPSHQCTSLPGRPRPRDRAGRRADTPDARPTQRRTSSQHTPPARPVRAVRGKLSGRADRPDSTDARPLTCAAGALRRRALRLGAPARHGHATLFGWLQISPARSLGRWFWTYRRRWQPARPQVAPMRTFEPGGASGHPIHSG
jgi:hypothetical protein